jgi:hypothetical protein
VRVFLSGVSRGRFVSRDKAYEPFLIALGRLATVWAEYEMTINVRIWELANVEKAAGASITSQLIGPLPRFRCLLALLAYRNSPQALIDEFNSHASQAEKIARQRNRYIHDPFVVDEDSLQMKRIEVTADKQVKMGIVQAEITELSSLCDKIGTLLSEIDRLWARVLAEVPAWPRKQFSQSGGIRLRHTDQNIGAKAPPAQPPSSQS